MSALPPHNVRSASAPNPLGLRRGSAPPAQVPQFLLEAAARDGRGGACSIICTQPRRISAIGLAERVAAERCERCGPISRTAISRAVLLRTVIYEPGSTKLGSPELSYPEPQSPEP